MKAPDKIYVNIPGDYWHHGTDEKVNTDTEYIRKDALLEWLEKRLGEVGIAGTICIVDVIDKLNQI